MNAETKKIESCILSHYAGKGFRFCGVDVEKFDKSQLRKIVEYALTNRAKENFWHDAVDRMQFEEIGRMSYRQFAKSPERRKLKAK